PETPPPAAVVTAAAPAKTRDFSNFSPLQTDMLASARRGADWLYRMNGVKGRFLYGYLPALQTAMEGDNYLKQTGAAFAPARAARSTAGGPTAVGAPQPIPPLPDEPATASKDAQVRHTALPSAAVNRLGAAGLLVLAIHELPSPQADLLDKAEQLCNYIHGQ